MRLPVLFAIADAVAGQRNLMFTLDRIRNLFLASALVLALAYSFAVQATVGQPGTLDPFWATGSAIGAGKVITPIGTGADFATAVAIQPDGKVVLAGQCNGTVNVGFCALRYNSDGTVDTSFGTGGKVITALGNFGDFATSVALQPDGKVLIAGQCKYNGNFGDFCALRYKPDGTLDSAFGVGGIAISALGVDDYAKAISLQPDGKILLAGSCVSSTYTFCARRYNPDGSLDANFGSGGTVVVSGLGTAVANAIAVQPDGCIFARGNVHGRRLLCGPLRRVWCARSEFWFGRQDDYTGEHWKQQPSRSLFTT